MGDITVGVKDGKLVCGVGQETKLGHVFQKDGDIRIAPEAELTEKKQFKLTFLATEDAKSVVDWFDPTAPLILDLDLDTFSTESPGSMFVQKTLDLAFDDLQVLYHLVWNFPKFDRSYFEGRNSSWRELFPAEDGLT